MRTEDRGLKADDGNRKNLKSSIVNLQSAILTAKAQRQALRAQSGDAEMRESVNADMRAGLPFRGLRGHVG